MPHDTQQTIPGLRVSRASATGLLPLLLHGHSVVFDSLRPIDCSPPGSSFRGNSQARILESVVISFSRLTSWPRDRTHVSCIAGRFLTAELPGKPRLWVCSAKTRWYLDPVLPLTSVLLVSRQPPHPTFPVAHVVLPLTLVYVPGLVTRCTDQTIKTSYLTCLYLKDFILNFLPKRL